MATLAPQQVVAAAEGAAEGAAVGAAEGPAVTLQVVAAGGVEQGDELVHGGQPVEAAAAH